MIEPQFLASLRRRHRAELVLVLVQLEQLAPGWWLTLHDLACALLSIGHILIALRLRQLEIQTRRIGRR